MPTLGKNLLLVALLFFIASPGLAAERATGGKPRSTAVLVPPCRVAEFRALALSSHDPAARIERVRAWLLEQLYKTADWMCNREG